MQTAADELRRKRMANLRPRPRVKGQANRITRDLRQAVIAAAEAYGCDGNGTGQLTGYLYFLAARHPKAFAGQLLSKMIPLQLSGSAQSVVEQVTIVSVPAGHFLSKDVPRTDS
jgi:hypothetical protein